MNDSNSIIMPEGSSIECPQESYDDNNEIQMKATFEDNYLDHMSSLTIKSSPSRKTLTTIACGVSYEVTNDLVEGFCDKGASMLVFDFSGLSYQQCRKMIYQTRQGVFNYSMRNNYKVPYSLALVLDLVGLRITTGKVFNSKAEKYLIDLRANEHVYVTNDTEYRDKCTEDRIYVNSDRILRLKKNDSIFLDYGKIELIVDRVDPDEVFCVIKRGDLLGSKKVVHIPGIPIGQTALTEQDEENIRTGIQLKLDIIMVPGVTNVEFFKKVKRYVCQEKGKDIDIYAKIDNSIGLENIDEFLPEVDGIFLHRPNLSMEFGYHRIFLAQKSVLSKCNIVGKPTMIFGGFLNSMEFNMVPSGAEINDIITTVLDGTDCIYLDVTARSLYKVHCVKYASSICRQGETGIWEQQLFSELNIKSKPKIEPAYAIGIGCVEVSLKCNAAAIIVITTTGLSAKIIARYRPRCPILAIVRHGKCAKKISTWRNVLAIHYLDPAENVWSKDVENRTKFAIDYGKKTGILNQGDLVLHLSCSKQNVGFTNAMKLFYINAGDFVNA